MTIAQARRIEKAFYNNPKPTEDDIFIFTEVRLWTILSVPLKI